MVYDVRSWDITSRKGVIGRCYGWVNFVDMAIQRLGCHPDGLSSKMGKYLYVALIP